MGKSQSGKSHKKKPTSLTIAINSMAKQGTPKMKTPKVVAAKQFQVQK